MTRSYLALTDSGGIQEEMPSLGQAALVMREKTEHPEGIEAGACRLVGTNPETISDIVLSLLDDKDAHTVLATRKPVWRRKSFTTHREPPKKGLSDSCPKHIAIWR